MHKNGLKKYDRPCPHDDNSISFTYSPSCLFSTDTNHENHFPCRAASSASLKPASASRASSAQKPRASIASPQTARKSVAAVPSTTESQKVTTKKRAVVPNTPRQPSKPVYGTSNKRSTIATTATTSTVRKGALTKSSSLIHVQPVKKAAAPATKETDKTKETIAELQMKNKELTTKVESLAKELEEKTKTILDLEEKTKKYETLKTKCNELQLTAAQYAKEQKELNEQLSELIEDRKIQKENLELITATSAAQQQELDSTRLQYDAQQKLVESLNDKVQKTEVVLTTKLELLTEELKEKDTHEVELERTVSDQEECILQQNAKITLLEKKVQEAARKKEEEIKAIEEVHAAKVDLLEEEIKLKAKEIEALKTTKRKLEVDLKETTKEKLDKIAKKIGAINILFQQFEQKYSKELENPPPSASIVITEEKPKAGVDMLKQVLELQSVLEDARARAARIQEERKSNEIEQKWLRDMIDSLILQLEAYQKQDGSINKLLINENKELKERLFYANVLTVKLSDPKLLSQSTYDTEDLFALALERCVQPQNYTTFVSLTSSFPPNKFDYDSDLIHHFREAMTRISLLIAPQFLFYKRIMLLPLDFHQERPLY